MKPHRLGLLAAPLFALLLPQVAKAEIVARVITIHIDQTGKGFEKNMGLSHEARIFYDDSQIDPVSHRVKILHEQHTPMLIPAHPDPVVMPVSNAWLDLGATPYRYHLAASPGLQCLANGKTMFDAYTIVFDENTHRMTIRSQATGELELSGQYVVGDAVQSGPKIQAVINDTAPASPYPPRCP